MDVQPKPTNRKILMIESGQYEEYRQAYFYAPDDFTWPRLAEELEKRKYMISPLCPKPKVADDVMELALKCLGCEPVKPDFRVNFDNFHITYDDDKVSYRPANAFIASLKGDR